MARLAAWATDPARQYRQEAVDEFLDSADYQLIAHAMATGATLVTREQPAPESKKNIKIPDACNAMGVPWTDPSSLYRTLGMRLVGPDSASEIPGGNCPRRSGRCHLP